MKKRIISSISVILAVIMAVTVFPMSVLADMVSDNVISEVSSTDIQELSEVEIVAEIEEKRTENEKHFKLSDGTFLAVQYSEPVHYLNEDNAWEEIDNSLTYEGKSGENDFNGYTNKANSFSAKFANSISDGTIFSVSDKTGEYTVRFETAESANNSIRARISNSEPLESNLQELTTAERNEQIIQPERSESAIKYNAVYSDTDFEYSVNSNGVKENIIINKKKNSYEYSFIMNTGTLSASLIEDGSITICEADGDIVFTVPAPFMYDADGNYSDDVEYRLTGIGNGSYRIDIIADSEWINASGTTMPVIIDPIVTLNPSNTTFKDAYVSSTAPDTNYSTYAARYVGRTDSSIRRTYAQFLSVPSLTASDVLISAKLHYEIMGWTSGKNYYAYNIKTGGWSYDTVTWNNQPAHSTEILDYAKTASGSSDLAFDITKAAKEWYYSGVTNRGIVLTSDDETAEHMATLYTIDSATNSYIEIRYRSLTGLEDSQSYTTVDVGSGSTMYVNNVNGNITITRDDITSNSSSVPFNITHIYNGNLSYKNAATDMKIGKGWRLNIQQTVTPITDGYLYCDEDGTEHYLYISNDSDADSADNNHPDSDNGVHYTDEYGLSVRIKNNISNASETLTFIDESENKKVFEYFMNKAYLAYEENANGDRITYTYDEDSVSRITKVEESITGQSATLTYNADNSLHEIIYNYNEADNTFSRKLTYSYDSAGCLTSVQDSAYPNTQIAYEYSTSNSRDIISVTDRSGKYTVVEYGDNTSTLVYNTASVKWRYSSEEAYNGASFNYAFGNSTEVTYFGDDMTKNTADDIKTTYAFDYYGRVITVYTESGDGEFLGTGIYGYADNGTIGQRNDSLSEIASVSPDSENLLTNTSYSVANANPAAESHSSETVTFTEPLTKSLILSGWAEAPDGAASTDGKNSKFALKAIMIYKDINGNIIYDTPQYIDFSYETTSKQYTSGVIKLFTSVGKTTVSEISGVTVSACYDYNINSAEFTDIRLTEGEALNIEYNGDNIESLSVNGKTQTRYEYNDETGLAEKMFDENDNLKEQYFYDGNKNLTEVKDGDGNIINTYSYDSNNNLTQSVIDGLTTNYSYTAWKEICSTEQIFNSVKLTSSQTYNNNRTLASETDSRGNTVSYAYNGDLLLTLVEDANSVQTGYTYNADGSTSSVHTDLDEDGVIDENESNIQYTYDNCGRIIGINANGMAYTFTYNAASLPYEIKVGNTALVTYAYNAAYDKVTSLTYANGLTKSYVYDILGNVTGYKESEIGECTECYEDFGCTECRICTVCNKCIKDENITNCSECADCEGCPDCSGCNGCFVCVYEYDGEGNITKITDNRSGYITDYQYDSDGTLENTSISSANHTISHTTSHDDTENTDTSTTTVDGTSVVYSTVYDDDGNLLKYVLPTGKDITSETDGFGRTSSETVKNGNDVVVNTDYSFETWTDSDGQHTSELVSSVTLSDGTTHSYTYDDVGNISSVANNYSSFTSVTGSQVAYTGQTVTTTYEYDSQGQLVRENNPIAGKTWTWTYDLNGNILTKSEYAYTTGELGEATDTVTYSYGNSTWKDQLTSYDGRRITYDALGNPLKLHNGKALEWSGRTLESVGNYSYSYNADGLLTAVSSGTSTNEIIRDTDGKVYSYLSLKYFYDSEGKPLGFTSGSYEYYFRYNLQGDVTGLINASTGNVDVIYEYDAHGNIISKAARTTISSNLSLKNIYLYRGAYGYFYEKNSGLYYLQTRFYDPVVGRFLNADDTDYLNASGTTLGCNLYAYCENNGVNNQDSTGTRVVGIGIQFELSVGWITHGVELVWYFDASIRNWRAWYIPYVYSYGGIGLSKDITSMISKLAKNPSLLLSPKSLTKLSASVSIFAIVGYSNFKNPMSYTGLFYGTSVTVWNVKGYTACGATCFVVGVGRSTSKFSTSQGYTHYAINYTLFSGITNLFYSIRDRAMSLV